MNAENERVERTEDAIRGCLGQGDLRQAVTLGLKSYGPEILGFLVASERDESAGSEAFSDFCEDLWNGIDRFRGDASFRTWAYTLARNAARRRHRDPYFKRGVPLTQFPALLEIAEGVRTSTLMHLRTEVKDAVERLREQLDPEDRDLLVLRVNRRMSWADIARVFEGVDATPQAVKQRSAALRKRFERVKRKLKEMARDEGLM